MRKRGFWCATSWRSRCWPCLRPLRGWALPKLYDFAAGALLATWNFYFLSGFVHRVLDKQRANVTGMLFRFYGRLILTGIALYALIALAGSSVIALLAGLSTVVVTVLIWALARMRG